ncbi:peptidoglycan recognition protein family protein [Tumebacillus permanentifrigoris]|uniref:N-acetylmuramoyl-L-alanine amidase n=1 Tax=Tumebacillus permanentifrigoris TaxID=378543 RepID=A0A316DE21_9BACL|nr:N-acetylmuramoyl-L-alanine amidase [Tumebacillus permanentifrigoris]PWK16477.1 N-acetylmuramoyl-L-alanine amidase [Tumebacillus permanentifrigoris]
MTKRRRTRVWASSIAVLMTGLLVVPSSSTPARAETSTLDTTLQTAFENAAHEFGVPQNVLMSVAYNETRWEQHGSEPSHSGGYGVMHLTQSSSDLEDQGKAGEEDTETAELAQDPTLHTLDYASQLIGVDADQLKQDLESNIRGGAALLAQYARETVGQLSDNPADWYGAVAKYSGSDQAEVATEFADDVYTTIQSGVEHTNANGQHAVLAAESVTPDKSTTNSLHLRNADQSGADCPNGLACRFLPATYKQFSSSATNYGNYDLANRPADGLDIRYIIIHDVEGSYESAIKTFQSNSSVSAHYVVNSANGQVTEMVRPENVAWHAGNWFINSHSIGIEHSGFAAEGGKWYSEQMYHASAKLVKYLADKYNVPLDRQHILGHDDLPGLSQTAQRGMHWDPGAYWDWSHYFSLLGASFNPSNGKRDSKIITIDANFTQNQPVLNYGSKVLEPQSANALYLYTAPSFDAPLISDPALHPDGSPGTTQINDWGDKVTLGQTFYQADSSGDWTAIYYGAKKAWFYNPKSKHTVPGSGTLVTPKAGMTSIPVYGGAYPEAAAFASAGIPKVVNNALQYRIPAGQVYVSAGAIPSDYFYAKLFNQRSTYKVVKGADEYYPITFNHRIAFLKKSDVDVVNP